MGQIRAEEPGKVWEEGDGQGVRHRQGFELSRYRGTKEAGFEEDDSVSLGLSR